MEMLFRAISLVSLPCLFCIVNCHLPVVIITVVPSDATLVVGQYLTIHCTTDHVEVTVLINGKYTFTNPRVVEIDPDSYLHDRTFQFTSVTQEDNGLVFTCFDHGISSNQIILNVQSQSSATNSTETTPTDTHSHTNSEESPGASNIRSSETTPTATPSQTVDANNDGSSVGGLLEGSVVLLVTFSIIQLVVIILLIVYILYSRHKDKTPTTDTFKSDTVQDDAVSTNDSIHTINNVAYGEIPTTDTVKSDTVQDDAVSTDNSIHTIDNVAYGEVKD